MIIIIERQHIYIIVTSRISSCINTKQASKVIINSFASEGNNNKAPETGEWVCGVGVGVRRGLRGAFVPRWSA